MPSPSHYEATGRLQRKIDVYCRVDGEWHYFRSTNWHRTCRDALASVAAAYDIPAHDLRANFAKG